ncbi:MAG TPA: hypothetical protein PKM65_13110 [Spirochaetota bacterium]|nr:hypothetical protein [Spirochaetota bacterium]HNT11004.1 hypothetical protein [Spirochaetota bacterium]
MTKKQKMSLISFLAISATAYAIFLAVALLRDGGAHVWITESWEIRSQDNPFIFAALCLAQYIWGPLLGLALGLYLVYWLFKKGLAFVVVGVFIIAMTGVMAYFSISRLSDPLGRDIVDFIGISALCLFLLAAGVAMFVGHVKTRGKSGGADGES